MLVRIDQMNQEDLRVLASLAALVGVVCLLTILSYYLDPTSKTARVLLDRQSTAFPYPFTVQNLMHVMFALGIGEAAVRIYSAAVAHQQMAKGLLDSQTTKPLEDAEIKEIHRHVLEDGAGRDHHLHRLLHRIIVQYEATGSTSDARAILDTSTELFHHALGLRYNLLRYLIWLLPTLGFIGTLVGISLALGEAAALPDLRDGSALEVWIQNLTGRLGIAFNTTLVGLGLSAILVFLNSIASGREEQALNDTSQYCLDHCISRLRNRNVRPTTPPAGEAD